MKAVVDRIVQYANRYQLTNVETGEVLGIFDFEEVTGTVQQVGTEIDKELFDSIANDLAARVKLSGGELAGTIVTFSDISGTAANVASGDTSATLWGKVKNWFSRLKALAFKNKVAVGDFEAGAIKNADVAADAAIAQSKVSGLMTDYVASISVSGRTVTYKNKNGVNMGSITTQDTTYGLASQSSNGLMSSTDKTKLDGIESGAQKNTVLGVKGSSESAYRTGNVNITKANIGLGNVDNTSDEDKPVSTATQKALNGKANTSGTYPNLTVGKATNADKATNATNATNAASATKATQDASGNVITSTYATKNELTSGLSGKANTSGTYPNMTVGGAEYLAKRHRLQTDGVRKGWLKIGTVPASAVGTFQCYNCIMIISGVYRGTEAAATAPKTAIVEFELRKYASTLGDTRMGILAGDIPADSLCFVVEDTLDTSYYIKNNYTENIDIQFEILSEELSNKQHANIFEFSADDTALASAPSGAVYAVVRNNASGDEDGNNIKETYAKKNGTYPNMTVGNSTNATNATNATHAASATNATNATNATTASKLSGLTSFRSTINLSTGQVTSDNTQYLLSILKFFGGACIGATASVADGRATSFLIGRNMEEVIAFFDESNNGVRFAADGAHEYGSFNMSGELTLNIVALG